LLGLLDKNDNSDNLPPKVMKSQELKFTKREFEKMPKQFKKELESYGITVYLDESLHIPHDTSAYTRSRVTAKKLLENYDLDAIFDIHRDGTSRSYYVKNIDGVERCRVRMVIGKSNPSREVTEQFAVYLLSIGQELYPWLFSDIYVGGGDSVAAAKKLGYEAKFKYLSSGGGATLEYLGTGKLEAVEYLKEHQNENIDA
jgi:stage II sporulation protein P